MEDLSGWFPGFTVQEAFDEFIAEHAEQDSSQENDYDPVCRAALAAKRTRNSSSRIRPVLKKSAPWQLMLDANAAGKNTIHDERSRDGKYFGLELQHEQLQKVAHQGLEAELQHEQ